MAAGAVTLACRREFPERNYEHCGKPAGYIVWGKLFDKEALGPRCRDCLEDQCGYRAPVDPSYAIYKLPVATSEIRNRLLTKGVYAALKAALERHDAQVGLESVWHDQFKRDLEIALDGAGFGEGEF